MSRQNPQIGDKIRFDNEVCEIRHVFTKDHKGKIEFDTSKRRECVSIDEVIFVDEQKSLTDTPAPNPMSMKLYKLVKANLREAITDEIRAKADLAQAEMGNRLWQEQDPFERSGYNSPYQVDGAKKRVENFEASRKTWDDLLDFVVQTFLEGKPPINSPTQ